MPSAGYVNKQTCFIQLALHTLTFMSQYEAYRFQILFAKTPKKKKKKKKN
jgi:hypothetical protein